MFHEGDLQSGIARTVQESKSVLCFVNDDSEEAGNWSQWLQGETLADTVAERAIALKLQAGSQEAGFLAAFCPVTSTPTIVLIYQGRLLLQLNSEVGKEDFENRMLEALRSISTSTSHVTSTANQVAAASHHEAAAASVELSAPPPPIPSDAQVASQLQHSDSPPVRPVARSSLPSEPVSSTPQVPDNIRTLLESRGQRLEQERVARETAEKAARDERIRERKTKDAEKAAAATPSDSVGKNRSYEAEQAKRKRDAKLDRERVLKQIENDKIARREKEERRKAAARGEQEPFPQQSLAPITSASKAATTGTTCALQIRLHDGSRIRNSFPATATLLTTVRPWIATESPESKDLFTLKLMQTPQPPRSLSDADEAMTLQELGLLPSATLVVVPVRGAVSTAYSGGTGGVFARIYAMLMGLIMWLIEMVQTFAGNRQQQAPSTSIDVSRAEESSSSASPATGNDAAPSSKIRIRTLKDKGNDNEKREFYNGNQLSFEPRPKDEDGEGEADA